MSPDVRRPRPHLVFHLLVASGLLFLGGCATSRVLPVAPIPLSDPVEVEIDDETVELHHPYLDEGELVGWQRHSRSDSTLVRIPYEQEVVTLDQRRSLIVGLGAFLGAVLLVILV